MKNKKLAHRYASALYDFAAESNSTSDIYKDILILKNVFLENTELRKVIESPILVNLKKKDIFDNIFQEHLSKTAFEFFHLIVLKRREPEMLDIFDEFLKIYYQENNIKEATIISAHELSDEMKQHLTTILEEKNQSSFIIHYKVDENIIGGVIIKVEDFLFDASILN